MLKVRVRFAKFMPVERRKTLYRQTHQEAVTKLFHDAIAAGIRAGIERMHNSTVPGTKKRNHIDTGMSAASLLSLLGWPSVFKDSEDNFLSILQDIQGYKKRDNRDGERDIAGTMINPSGKENIITGLERGAINKRPSTGSMKRLSLAINYNIQVYQWTLFEEHWRTLDAFERDFTAFMKRNAADRLKNKRILKALKGEL